MARDSSPFAQRLKALAVRAGLPLDDGQPAAPASLAPAVSPAHPVAQPTSDTPSDEQPTGEFPRISGEATPAMPPTPPAPWPANVVPPPVDGAVAPPTPTWMDPPPPVPVTAAPTLPPPVLPTPGPEQTPAPSASPIADALSVPDAAATADVPNVSGPVAEPVIVTPAAPTAADPSTGDAASADAPSAEPADESAAAGMLTGRFAALRGRIRQTGSPSPAPASETTPVATIPNAATEDAAETPAFVPPELPAKPSFAERAALRRRVKTLRARRDTGLLELGAILLDQRRFGDPTSGALVRRRTDELGDLDMEIASIEHTLDDAHPTRAVETLGTVRCLSCDSLLGPADRFCAHCGTPHPGPESALGTPATGS